MPRGYRKDGTPLGRPKGMHGVGAGQGWGGEAGGTSTASPSLAPFTSENQPDPEAVAAGRKKSAIVRDIFETNAVKAAQAITSRLTVSDPRVAMEAAKATLSYVVAPVPTETLVTNKTNEEEVRLKVLRDIFSKLPGDLVREVSRHLEDTEASEETEE